MNRLCLMTVVRSEACLASIAVPSAFVGVVWLGFTLRGEQPDPMAMFLLLFVVAAWVACFVSFALSRSSSATGSLTDVVLVRSGVVSVVRDVVILGMLCGLVSSVPTSLLLDNLDGSGLDLTFLLFTIEVMFVGAASGMWWGLRGGSNEDLGSAVVQTLSIIAASIFVSILLGQELWLWVGLALGIVVTFVLSIRRLQWSCASGR